MNIQEKFTKFIKGETLLNEEAMKSWRMIFFIIILLIIMTRSGHLNDEKVLKIARLEKQEKELRAEYIAIRTKSMKLKLETTVIEKVKETGLHPAEKPAQVIREVTEQQ